MYAGFELVYDIYAMYDRLTSGYIIGYNIRAENTKMRQAFGWDIGVCYTCSYDGLLCGVHMSGMYAGML